MKNFTLINDFFFSFIDVREALKKGNYYHDTHQPSLAPGYFFLFLEVSLLVLRFSKLCAFYSSGVDTRAVCKFYISFISF